MQNQSYQMEWEAEVEPVAIAEVGDVNIRDLDEPEPSNVRSSLMVSLSLIVTVVAIFLLVSISGFDQRNPSSISSLASKQAVHLIADNTDGHLSSASYFGDIMMTISGNFSVHAGVSVNFEGAVSTIDHGNLGVSPGTEILGDFVIIDGIIENNDSPDSITCQAEKQPQIDYLNSLKCDYTIASGDTTGLTLVPGVYCSGTGSWTSQEFGITTLDAVNYSYGKWIFQTPSGSITTGVSSSIYLLNGALSMNVFWAVGNGVVLSESSNMVGSVIATKDIQFLSDATIIGHALSVTSVTFEGASSTSTPLPLVDEMNMAAKYNE